MELANISLLPHPPLNLPLEGGEVKSFLPFKGRTKVGMGDCVSVDLFLAITRNIIVVLRKIQFI